MPYNFYSILSERAKILKRKPRTEGLFQKNLDPQIACQLIRIQMPQQLGFYPEISASKHRVNIRFLNGDPETKRTQFPSSNVPFELACCAI